METREIVFVKKDNLWIRPWESDRYIYAQVKKDYKRFVVSEDDVILDIGANIGAFPVFMNSISKAKQIASFEPVHDTFLMAQRNVEQFDNTTVAEYAVVHNPDKPIDYVGQEEIYISNASGMCSLYKIRGRKTETIKTVEFRQLLEYYKPTILKIDCEGSEFELLKHPIPSQVKQMIVEFTFKKCFDGEKMMEETYHHLIAQGFTMEGVTSVDQMLPSRSPKKGFFANMARTYYIYRP